MSKWIGAKDITFFEGMLDFFINSPYPGKSDRFYLVYGLKGIEYMNEGMDLSQARSEASRFAFNQQKRMKDDN